MFRLTCISLRIRLSLWLNLLIILLDFARIVLVLLLGESTMLRGELISTNICVFIHDGSTRLE